MRLVKSPPRYKKAGLQLDSCLAGPRPEAGPWRPIRENVMALHWADPSDSPGLNGAQQKPPHRCGALFCTVCYRRVRNADVTWRLDRGMRIRYALGVALDVAQAKDHILSQIAMI